MYKKHILFFILVPIVTFTFGMENIIYVNSASNPVLLQDTDTVKGDTYHGSFIYYTLPTISIDSIKIYYTEYDIEAPIRIDSVLFNKGFIDETKDSLSINDTSETGKLNRFLSSSKKIRKDGIDIRKKMVLYEGNVGKNLYFDDNCEYFQDKSGIFRISDSLYYFFQKHGIIDKWENYVQDTVLMKEGIVFSDGTEINEDEDDNQVYGIVEEEACFPDGQEAYEQWINENAVFPSEINNLHGNFLVMGRFTVNRDGSIEDIKVSRTNNKYFIREVERICKIMPKWTPARLGGKIVRGRGSIFVFFKN